MMKEDIVNSSEDFAPKKPPVEVNLRSEVVQEIISRRPDFMEKWALLFFLFIVLLVFIGSWFIKYPETIDTLASITTQNAPKEIISKQNGRLAKLFVHNNEQVSSGQVIGCLESIANPTEINNLYKQIDSSISLFNLSRYKEASQIFQRRCSNLGEVQQDYQRFLVDLEQFNDYVVNGFYLKKKSQIENEIKSLDIIKIAIKKEKELIQQDVLLTKKTLDTSEKTLYKNHILKEEFRLEKDKYVNKLTAIHQFNASFIETDLQQRVKIGELGQLNHDLERKKVDFGQILQTLKAQLEEWKRKYTLQSPVNGRIYFISALQENQYLHAGKLLGYVEPVVGQVYAETKLSQYALGKVNRGLSVQLRFDAYPYQELGSVEGKLDFISSVPSENGFLATIKLNKGLMTNNHKLIPYRNGLKAHAIIITQKTRLLDRLYSNFFRSTSVVSK